MPQYFVYGRMLVILQVYAVTNACTRIVFFLHVYHACDVLSSLLYIMCGRPFVVVSLRALSASGLLHSTVV